MHAVEGVSLSLDEGDVLGIVGESGSGKSVTMLALMGLVAYPGRVRAKRLDFAGHDLLGSVARARRKVIGGEVAMIFQEPTTSLNPCFTIGFQLAETLGLHLGMDRKAARKRSIEFLELVGIPAAEARLRDFPHQMSGGMNQRVMIAMAIACNPRLLIADEPTTALDVTIQAQILDLLRPLQQRAGDGAGARHAQHGRGGRDRPPRGGDVRRAGDGGARRVDALFAAPQHPYTAALLSAMPERHVKAATARDDSRASCPACTIVPPAAFSRRAAPTPPPLRAAARVAAVARAGSCAATIRWVTRARGHPRAGLGRAREP